MYVTTIFRKCIFATVISAKKVLNVPYPLKTRHKLTLKFKCSGHETIKICYRSDNAASVRDSIKDC